METQSFRSDLTYSVQNEDYRTELAVLRRVRRVAPLRVLMVASAGENPLSVLTDPMVGEVHAVDINPSQLHFTELRRAAIVSLSRDEQLRLFGADPDKAGSTGAAERSTLYERMKTDMAADACAFWDTRRDTEVAFGLQHVGRNDVLMRDLQTSVRRAGFAPLEHALAENDLPAWQAAYVEVMTVPYFREKFGLPNDAIAGKLAALAPRVAELHFRALRQPDARLNYFVTTALASRYAGDAGEDGLPAYLQTHGQAVLREWSVRDRLHLHAGSIFEQAKRLAAEGPFDLISISNVADWMDEAQFAATVEDMRGCLAAGGALLARTANASRMIIDVLGRVMGTDPEFNAQLSRIERGPWFRVVGAAFHE